MLMNETAAKVDYNKRIKLYLLKMFHFAICVGLFYGAWMIFRYDAITGNQGRGFRYNYFILIGYGILVIFFNRTYNAYLLGYARIRTIVFGQFLSQLFSIIIIYAAVSIAWAKLCSPHVFIILLAVYVIINILWSLEVNKYYCRLYPPRNTLLVYRNAQDKRRFGSIAGKPIERLYKITKEIQFDGSFNEIENELKGYQAICVAGVNSRCRNGILKYCEENGVRGFFLPHVGDVILQGAQHIQSFDSPVLMARRKVLQPEYRTIKRLFDIVASASGLIILSPIILITAILIKVYDRGPVFYKQTRLTRNGKQFKIIKFRSMKVDAEKDGIARLSAGKNDDRITPIGKVIRKCRLDELPQLWNILMGDMSIVGPRPERPEIAEKYYQKLPDFRLRLQVKAGLTGYAQVYGKYNLDPYEKLEFDLLYINNMSILTDLKLIIATIGILFVPDSTEGINVNQVTAMDYDAELENIQETGAG